MIFHLLIVFLFTFNVIDSESQDKKDNKLVKFKPIVDKICIDKLDKNLADKIPICENLIKTTVNTNIYMNIEFKIDLFNHFYFYFY